ncbi:MAG: Nif3-like dinuclear metal center hexameric protein, partial [Actinomycetales bacterium]
MTSSTVGQVVGLLQGRYPLDLAADWDAVGLICGRDQASVGRVLFAIDPVQAVVDEAIERQVDLVVVHHP